MKSTNINSITNRYSRQVLLSQIGEQGQQKLLNSSVLIIGCGALGTFAANMLVRAGVGYVKIVDRDIVEYSNLQRQILFNEEDAKLKMPKAAAAEQHLKKINSLVKVEGIIKDISSSNIEQLCEGINIILDGTDNFETRYLINDISIKLELPWIYTGVIGTTGMTFNILPKGKPCLRCVFPEPPAPGSLPKCNTHGVLNAAVSLIGSIQVSESLKILLNDPDVSKNLTTIDIWNSTYTNIRVKADVTCCACEKQEYDFLSKKQVSWITNLCGRNSVQITPPKETNINLEELKSKLSEICEVNFSGFMLQISVENAKIIVFPDGRAIVEGTTDQSIARSLYSRFIGD